MLKRVLLIIALMLLGFALVGCHTAQGLKEDATYIGDKTAEIIDK